MFRWLFWGFIAFLGEVNWCLAQDVPQDVNVDEVVYGQIVERDLISRDDIKLYKHAFQALKANNYGEVDALLAQVQSPMLKGHVLAEKYLSANYNSSYDELNAWLDAYYDLPQAKRIYRLAERKAKNVVPSYAPTLKPYEKFLLSSAAYQKLPAKSKKYLQKEVKRFFTAINRGKTRVARSVLETKKFRMLIPNRYWDEMATTLSLVYLLDNNDKLALQWTDKPTRRSHMAMAYWVRGLAAWKLKQFKTAAASFAKLSEMKKNDEWLVSAGGYWAYRSYMRLGQPKNAEKYLKQAARYKRTFYGVLAAYTLGEELDCSWENTVYWNDFSSDAYVNDLLESPAIVRAVALYHAKRPDLANLEISSIYSTLSQPQKEAVMFLAEENNHHTLAMRISHDLRNYDKNIYYDALAYPMPDWTPQDGWKANKALLFAVSRQESSFNPRAVSPSGACGLMQLLPSTATYMTHDNFKKDKSKLFEIDYNLYAGQKYVNYLLNKDYIKGDLFLMLTAYNAGPGNLQKWKKKMRFQNDPLLFIELIPAKQTRIYVERVMTNFWLYSLRMGEVPESLEQIKSGLWPVIEQGKDYQANE